MIGSAVASILMAGLLSTYTFLGRNLARLASYQALESESRKAMSYLSRDFVFAQSAKTGTSPTDSSVTLVLPAGEVTYTFDSATKTLRRQATFGASPDLTFLHNSNCECASFEFRYYTLGDGTAADQLTPALRVPYSIKRIQVRYALQSPSTWSAMNRTRYEAASARYSFHNPGTPDGT